MIGRWFASPACALLIGALAAPACGAKKPQGPDVATASTDATPPPGAAPPSAQAEPGPAAPPGTEQTAVASTAGAAPTADESAVDVTEICQTWCGRISQQCSESKGKKCSAFCPNYQDMAARCPSQAKAALNCAASAKDLICAGVSPESCTKAFQSLTACNEGTATVQAQTQTETQTQLPPGWERFTDKAAGFSALFPKGAKLTEAEGKRIWTAEVDGVEYFAAKLPPTPQMPTDKQLLFMVLDFMGCQKDYKLHGRIEKAGHVTVRFDSKCKDGSVWHGIWRVDQRGSYPLAFKALPGKNGVTDDFFYSFQYLSP